jgi:ADP-dependent NAD(P)H-hydrate dehydratase / NAD(P)H-hydrate epimerase
MPVFFVFAFRFPIFVENKTIMKVLTIEQIREADRFTIENEPVASIDLMERAATALLEWFRNRLKTEQIVQIFCGMGNNGGDGLALARLLINNGYQVFTHIVLYGPTGSPDFKTNLERLRDIRFATITELGPETVFPVIEKSHLVVDCLFGSGLNKPVTGFVAGLIEHINDSGAVVVSVDMPSGLFADKPTELLKKHVVKADYTLSFETAKRSFLVPENDLYVGHWEVLPIGLHHEYLRDVAVNTYLISGEDVRQVLKNRQKFAHKGNFGHSLILAGSMGKSGAAVLSALACLRSGTGLLHVHTPLSSAVSLQVAVPEAMLSLDPDEAIVSRLPHLGPFNAVAAGPGLGMDEQTAKVIRLLIQESKLPLVLDADALNLLSENKTWLSFLPAGTILTPHPREFERLAGGWRDSFERIDIQREFSVRFQVYVVFKGAHSCISTPAGECWFNATGNPGMATAGSGDVLTGIITGLLAQNYSPFEAAMAGVYLHGLAGDFALDSQSPESLIATDIIAHLGQAFNAVRMEG